MGLRLKKARQEVKPETNKVNVVEKLGAHFKKAFSKKKQSDTQPLEKAFVQEFPPAITTHPSLFPKEAGCSLKQSETGVVQEHIAVQEKSHVPESNVADNRHGTDDSVRNARNEGFVIIKPTEPASCNESIAEDSQEKTQRQDHVSAGPSNPLPSTVSSDFEISTPRNPRKARPSSCPSPSTSSPDSNHSSETLFSTPRHSETSSSPGFAERCRTVDKHEDLDNHCWLVLAEHLKTEEHNAENATWEMVVEWMKVAHQTEVAELQSRVFIAETILAARNVDLANESDDHEADLKTIDTLKEERSGDRRRLSECNTKLRNAKKEVRGLKNFIKETIEQHSISETSMEREDTQAEAERLAGASSPYIKEVRKLQEDRDAFKMAYGEANAKKHGKGKEKEESHKQGSRAENTARQQASKWQALDESTVESPGTSTLQATSTGEARKRFKLQSDPNGNDDSQAYATRVQELEKQKERLEENLEYATNEVARLRSDATTAQGEARKLKAENHFAQIEVGHCHAANALYRHEMEDENPARTAHIDGYLKRKDEAYAELETRAAGCAKQLAEEKKNRGIDNVYADGRMKGLKKELAHQSNMITALTEGRDILKERKKEIFQMFEKKVFVSDIEKTFRHDYDVIQKDNTLLIKMINERRCYLEDAEKPVADLKAEKLILENAAQSDLLKQRQMQQSINGLEAQKGQLQDKVKILTELREETEEELNSRIKQQAEEIERLLRDGADDGWRRRAEAQAQEIASCREEMTRLAGIASQWHVRAMEVQDDFCPMLRNPEVRDWNAEESRWRLCHAERRAADLVKESAELKKELRKLRGARPQVQARMVSPRQGGSCLGHGRIERRWRRKFVTRGFLAKLSTKGEELKGLGNVDHTK